jgi:hypothetical protein
MIQGMGKQYKEGERKCRKLTDGSEVCVSQKAWSVFFAKVNKEYGSGAEERPRSRSKDVGESEGELSELEIDLLVEYYLKKNKEEDKNDK